jgi:hypothetical protein
MLLWKPVSGKKSPIFRRLEPARTRVPYAETKTSKLTISIDSERRLTVHAQAVDGIYTGSGPVGYLL